MGVAKRVCAVLTAGAWLSLLLTQPVGAGTSPQAIAVSGNHLVNSSGQVVELRGVNISGTEFTCAQGWDGVYGDQPLDQESTYAAMRTWSVNVVRVPVNEDCWLGINNVKPTAAGPIYQEAIRTEINLIHAAGMYAIIDLHWSAPATQLALSQNPAPDADHSVTFWHQVAAAYKSDAGVIFDVFNEPYDYWGTQPDHWAGWLNGDTYTQYVTGGSPYTVNARWRSVGVQGLVTTIRSAGATQPILANGLDWANDLSGWLTHTPHDPLHQLIAGWHVYPGQRCSTTSCWDAEIAPIAREFPVIAGETGDVANGAVAFLPTFIPWADEHGLSYLAWTWNPWQDSSNVLIKDWDGTPTYGEGAFYRQQLTQPHTTPGTLSVAPIITRSVARRSLRTAAVAVMCLLALVALGAIYFRRRALAKR